MKSVDFVIKMGICLCCASCGYNRMKECKMQEYVDEGFSFRHPRNVVVEKETPVEDFNIYKFKYNKDILLSAYVGNQPSFKAGVQGITLKKSGFVNGLPYQRVRVKEPDGTLRMEVLITFSEGRDWPMFIHFWYFDLPSDLERIAEDVIASTREL